VIEEEADHLLSVTWESLAAIVGIASVLTTLAVVYLRLFVDGRLERFKNEITNAIERSISRSYLSKHEGEIVDLKLATMERRIERVEQSTSGSDAG